MLDPQVLVDLLLQLAVRHNDFLSEDLSEIAFRFDSTGSLVVTLPPLRVRGIFYCYSGGDPYSLVRGRASQA
jgi:hypothetical protein